MFDYKWQIDAKKVNDAYKKNHLIQEQLRQMASIKADPIINAKAILKDALDFQPVLFIKDNRHWLSVSWRGERFDMSIPVKGRAKHLADDLKLGAEEAFLALMANIIAKHPIKRDLWLEVEKFELK